MHGEYKTPSGKLVAVDFEVREGRLADVAVSGDFFLEPPEALPEIAASLEKVPAGLTEEELAARVRDSLGPEVEMVGFSPEAVARAVGRGLAGARRRGPAGRSTGGVLSGRRRSRGR